MMPRTMASSMTVDMGEREPRGCVESLWLPKKGGGLPGDYFARAISGGEVCVQHLLDGCRTRAGGFDQHILNCTRNAHERDGLRGVGIEECGDRNFVGGIERNG